MNRDLIKLYGGFALFLIIFEILLGKKIEEILFELWNLTIGLGIFIGILAISFKSDYPLWMRWVGVLLICFIGGFSLQDTTNNFNEF